MSYVYRTFICSIPPLRALTHPNPHLRLRCTKSRNSRGLSMTNTPRRCHQFMMQDITSQCFLTCGEGYNFCFPRHMWDDDVPSYRVWAVFFFLQGTWNMSNPTITIFSPFYRLTVLDRTYTLPTLQTHIKTPPVMSKVVMLGLEMAQCKSGE